MGVRNDGENDEIINFAIKHQNQAQIKAQKYNWAKIVLSPIGLKIATYGLSTTAKTMASSIL